MNRNKLKVYAPKARRDFIKAVTDRAAFYGLTKKRIEPVIIQGDVAIIGGKPFPKDVGEKRGWLEERIKREGFEQVIEAMAYTWFNRFAAIRFMELHGYLEHGYRVFSTTPVEHPKRGPGSTGQANTTNSTNEQNKSKSGLGGERALVVPEILLYAEHLDLPGVDRGKVVELKLAGNRDEELYRMLLVGQCNALNKAMPFLFEKVGDATELLLPENLLHSDSLIRRMVNEVPEEEWEAVEIIGWLYQFYISEKKDQVIGKVVKSEDIPAATQLFTPNWIVKYMVQNTLGRLWMATYPNSPLKNLMEYYIEPSQQTPEVEEQLKAITPDSLNPEELTLADVACGSGHILVEGYDLFKAIYQERGYRAKDIPRLILEKNLYGLDIDDRAAQLAAFALMMKAREDDRRIFERGVKLNVLAIQNSPKLDDEALQVLTTNNTNNTNKGEEGVCVGVGDLRGLLELFEHGKTFGSLIRVPEELGEKLPVIAERVEEVLEHGEMFGKATAEAILPIVQQARILVRTYDAGVTNPPYMGSGAMPPQLKRLAIDKYPDSKSDLFAMFIERNLELVPKYGWVGMITMHSWMFISSFENLRKKLLDRQTILSLAHLGARAFDSIGGEVVSTSVFVLGHHQQDRYLGSFLSLLGGDCEAEKQAEFRSRKNEPYLMSASDLAKIPGSPIAYWVPRALAELFDKNPTFSRHFEPREGLTTGNNDANVRLWHEVNSDSVARGCRDRQTAKATGRRWFPYNKGGEFRKWAGNDSFIVNWFDDGRELQNTLHPSGKRIWAHNFNLDFIFRPFISWSDITTKGLFVREFPRGYLFDATGLSAFKRSDESKERVALGICNSAVGTYLAKILNPTLHFKSGDFARLPYVNSEDSKIHAISSEAVKLAHTDWLSYEISSEFVQIPLLAHEYFEDSLYLSYSKLHEYWRTATFELLQLEEKNNIILIKAYGLQDELTPEVPLSEITLTCNPHYRYGGNRSEEELEALLRADTMKELVSYAVGCMMGRYSLDAPGLIYAHSGNHQFQEIYHQKHNHPLPPQPHSCNSCYSWSTFPPDEDGIIPITDTDWFPDDAVNRFIGFISVAWSKEHLEENLKFVSESLSPNRTESPRETIRRYMATGFFKHHLKMYKKRPIYWLFSSGKQKAFQCLVYLHRYNEGTLARMRTEYVIPLQGKISARIEQLVGDVNAATSTAHSKKLERERGNLIKQQAELQTFDEKLRHYADQRISLDLDDGVKVNYGKFGELLAEVNAITGKG